MAGSDFTAMSPVSLNFSSVPGEERCIPISIADDTEQEGTEEFIATVNIMDSDDREVRENVFLEITDNDG